MVTWQIVFTKQARKDAEKLAAAGLKPKAEELLAMLAADPFRKPPPFEKLVGDLRGPIPEGSISGTGSSMKKSSKRIAW